MAKVISIEEDYNSGERVYKVVLSNKQGEYIAGEVTYVSVRSVVLINQDKESIVALTKEIVQNNNKKSGSPSGTKETLYFKKNGHPVSTERIYLVDGQRFKIRSTSRCQLGGTREELLPGSWRQATATFPGGLDIYPISEDGRVDIEVL